jgi:hypothetical protein
MYKKTHSKMMFIIYLTYRYNALCFLQEKYVSCTVHGKDELSEEIIVLIFKFKHFFLK